MRKKFFHQFACSSLMLPGHRARLARHCKKPGKRSESCPARPTSNILEQIQRLVERCMEG